MDVLLQRVDHELGRGTGEQSNKINFARFVRVCGEKGEDKPRKQLESILKEMAFTTKHAQDQNDSLQSMAHFSHISVSEYERNISLAAHTLVHSVREVVRLMQPVSRTAEETRDETNAKALSKMLVACHVFLHPASEDVADPQTRAESLLQALKQWRGNGLMQDEGDVQLKRQHYQVQQALTNQLERLHAPELSPPVLYSMVEYIEEDCSLSMNHIHDGFLMQKSEIHFFRVQQHISPNSSRICLIFRAFLTNYDQIRTIHHLLVLIRAPWTKIYRKLIIIILSFMVRQQSQRSILSSSFLPYRGCAVRGGNEWGHLAPKRAKTWGLAPKMEKASC